MTRLKNAPVHRTRFDRPLEARFLHRTPIQARSGPADPRKGLKLLLALILAPVLCSGIAFLMNYLDNTVKTPAELESLLGLPVRAVVPMAKSVPLADGGRQVPAMIGASYQMLSTNLWISHADMEGRCVLVASAEPDVGRSTTAANLAISLARDGARVILVDSDLRQPSQHDFFGVSNEVGLSNILAGKLSLKDALQPTSVTDLLLIPSGPLPANPVRLFRSPEMVRFVKEINELADFVIFDSPSGAAFADPTLLAVLVKNVVIVHAAGNKGRHFGIFRFDRGDAAVQKRYLPERPRRRALHANHELAGPPRFLIGGIGDDTGHNRPDKTDAHNYHHLASFPAMSGGKTFQPPKFL